MALTESTILASVNINHTAPSIEVRWDNIIKRGEEVISRIPHRKAYSQEQLQDFLSEVDGGENYVGLIQWQST